MEQVLAQEQELAQAPELVLVLVLALVQVLELELASGQPQTLRQYCSGSGRSGEQPSEQQWEPAGSHSPRC